MRRSIDARIAALESRVQPESYPSDAMREAMARLTDDQLEEMIEHITEADAGRTPRPLSFTWPPDGVLADA